MGEKLLLIRFSSFGDIVQAIGVPNAFREHFGPASRVDWLVRSDMQGLLERQSGIDNVIAFKRADGFSGLIRLAWRLAGLKTALGGYTHLYDAHQNLRSKIFCAVFRLRSPRVMYASRSKQRIRRWLYFRFRLPVLPTPFRGANSFHAPLRGWGLPGTVPDRAQIKTPDALPDAIVDDLKALGGACVALAPSAAWEMKRWPTAHWIRLIELLPNAKFVLLGGPEDLFLEDIRKASAERVLNLAGRLNLEQNAAVFEYARAVVANDTGLLHLADQMAKPTFALIGPTAFGYPSHTDSRTLEISLDCKPCSKDGRGGCRNSVYKRCLVELTPEMVASAVRPLLDLGPA